MAQKKNAAKAKEEGKKKPKKPYWEMTTEELAEATKEFDHGPDEKDLKPLSPKMRRQWQAWKKKFGRPKIGQGAVRVMVSMEAGLLKHASATARQRGVKRSKLIALALESFIGLPGRNEPR